MAIPYAQPGEVVDIQPLGTALTEHTSRTLVKTNDLEIIRLILRQAKKSQRTRPPAGSPCSVLKEESGSRPWGTTSNSKQDIYCISTPMSRTRFVRQTIRRCC